MAWLIKFSKSDKRAKTLEYKTERGMRRRFSELAKDPDVTRIRIFKEVTYGEQMSLFYEDRPPY